MEQKYSYYKKQSINKYDLFDVKTNNAQDALKNHILDSYPIHYTDDGSDYEQAKAYKDQAEYVWLVDRSITILKTFPFWFRPPKDAKETVFKFPYVFKHSRRVKDWNKVQLVSTDFKKVVVSSQRNICGEYDPYNGKEKFDMFFLVEKTNMARFEEARGSFPDIQPVKTINEAIEKSETDMFWLIPDDVILNNGFEFDYEPDEWSYNYCHMFQNDNKKNYNGVVLIPKNYVPTNREVTYRHYASKKLVTIPASRPEKYDLFYADTYEEFLEAQQRAESSMFWIIRSDLVLNEKFDFEYRVPKWDQQYIHVFLNGKHYDGVALFPVSKQVSKKEFENRYYTDQKQVEVEASIHTPYQKIYADTFRDYLLGTRNLHTDMVWIIRSDFKVEKDFDFDLQIPFWEKNLAHVFLNNKEYNGLALLPANNLVPAKEFDSRLYADKKEWDIVASHPRSYQKLSIDTFEEYWEALEQAETELFWAIPSDVEVNEKFNFDLKFSHNNEHDRYTNHVFLNKETYDGIMLLTKNRTLSEKEFKTRCPLEKKEWKKLASTPKIYDIYEIDSYEEYLDALKNSKTEMFWMTGKNLKIADDFKFDLYFGHQDVTHRSMNHAFIHKVGERELFNGVFLLSKNVPVTQKEIEKRYLIEKKEWNIIASEPITYTVYK